MKHVVSYVSIDTEYLSLFLFTLANGIISLIADIRDYVEEVVERMFKLHYKKSKSQAISVYYRTRI